MTSSLLVFFFVFAMCDSRKTGGLISIGAPEQIMLTWGSGITQVVVSWAVFGQRSGPGCVVEWGTQRARLHSISVASGRTYNMTNPRWVGKRIVGSYPMYTSPTLFTAMMSDLEPGGNSIFYRVGCDGRFSSIRSFRSHPGVGQEALQGRPVTFQMLGDCGQTNNSASTLRELLSTSQRLSVATNAFVGGVIDMGDLSYADGNEPLWDSYRRLIEPVASTIPHQTVVGNHEW